MDVFDLRKQVVDDYASFARSFTQIRAADLKTQIDAIYAQDKFWPEPLLQITPYYEPGGNVDALAADGSIDPTTSQIFRVPAAPEQPLNLYTHQVQALTAANHGRSYVVTTGTGYDLPAASRTKLSERFETHRLSHTGSVYSRVFYLESNGWRHPLESLKNAALVRTEHSVMAASWKVIEDQLG